MKSSPKTLQIRSCPCNGSDNLCLLCIQELGCKSSLRELIIMRCGAIHTRGNFPLPFNALRCRSNKGQLSIAMQLSSSKGQFSSRSEVVRLKSKFRAR
ncbi:hypothetical protein HYC85_028694 [Camellia sinensis]|uniref:Uncharacterized protein n=1 Tax=Camellia sinensis TaxID=4442 RepID=A0A7J7FVW6_CAMSI|nr:hypothetical protein HYC85_028694 [Camellia sinensis]